MARADAPPYLGEGEHALWHVSEEPGIARFEPRPAAIEDGEPIVWAVDTRHLPLFWFPRDCPRATFWAGPDTGGNDVERFLAGDRTRRVHAIEADWLDRMRDVRLLAYRMPQGSFERHREVGGYWVARHAVDAIEAVELADPVDLHAAAGVELRVVPLLAPLWQRVISSTLEFSGIRLRNARVAA